MSRDSRENTSCTLKDQFFTYIWKVQTRAILLGKDLMDVEDGTEAKPAETTSIENKLAWNKQKIMLHIAF